MGKTRSGAQTLWSPERGRCSQCGLDHDHVRRFTSGDSQTVFCRVCWDGFIRECNVASGPWESDVADTWHMDVDLSLEFDGDQNGASQRPGVWN